MLWNLSISKGELFVEFKTELVVYITNVNHNFVSYEIKECPSNRNILETRELLYFRDNFIKKDIYYKKGYGIKQKTRIQKIISEE